MHIVLFKSPEVGFSKKKKCRQNFEPKSRFRLVPFVGMRRIWAKYPNKKKTAPLPLDSDEATESLRFRLKIWNHVARISQKESLAEMSDERESDRHQNLIWLSRVIYRSIKRELNEKRGENSITRAI